MNNWLVRKDNRYQMVEQEDKPKGAILKMGDAVSHWAFYMKDPKTALVEKVSIAEDGKSVVFHLQTSVGNRTLAKGDEVSPIWPVTNWFWRWWVSRGFKRHS